MRLDRPPKSEGKKIVLIVGGGFGGLSAAKHLSNRSDVYVILLDQRNHHLFQPLLYQVATGGLNPADIAVPIRAQFSHAKNVQVHMGRISSVNLTDKFVTDTKGVELVYDFLILACGAQHSYFGHPEWEDFAPGLKTLEQATEIRRRILNAFEMAENEFDTQKQKALLTFVVVGGGATGVELAGAIADIARTVLVKDFKRINPASARVLLVEAGPRLLPAFDTSLSTQAQKDLTTLGVEVRINSKVENINAGGVMIGTEFLTTPNVFWGAGVQAAKLDFKPEVKLDRASRVIVTKDFSIPEFQNTFVIGDMASLDLANQKLLPGLAPAAIQAGTYVAKSIINIIEKRPHRNFNYLDKGQLATIGKRKAIMQVKDLKVHGYIAWLAWFFVHILYIVSFKNKVAVFFQWTWSYLFSKRGARLITDKNWKLPK